MSAGRVAGVRLEPGAPLAWCACEPDVRVGEWVVVEMEGGAATGRVVVAPEQLLPATAPLLAGRVLRPATAAERAAWEADRFTPRAGRALAAEIEQRPPDAR